MPSVYNITYDTRMTPWSQPVAVVLPTEVNLHPRRFFASRRATAAEQDAHLLREIEQDWLVTGFTYLWKGQERRVNAAFDREEIWGKYGVAPVQKSATGKV